MGSEGSASVVVGWLWTRDISDDSNRWQRKFAKATATTMSLFNDEEVGLSHVFPLSSSSLREVTLSGVLPLSVRRHARGFILQADDHDSPRAVAEHRADSQLDLTRHTSTAQGDSSAASETSSSSSGPAQLVLAADNADEHVAWLRTLSKRSSSAAFVPPRDSQSNNASGTHGKPPLALLHIAKPPPSLLHWLAEPGNEHGSELAARLRDARTGLSSSCREAGSLFPPDALRAAQQPLIELQACCLGIARLVQSGNASDACDAIAHGWLLHAASFAENCTAAADEAVMSRCGVGLGAGLDAVGSSAAGAGWEASARNAAILLHDVEEALREEVGRRMRSAGEGGAGYGGGCALLHGACRARPSALPYRSWWAKKPTT